MSIVLGRIRANSTRSPRLAARSLATLAHQQDLRGLKMVLLTPYRQRATSVACPGGPGVLFDFIRYRRSVFSVIFSAVSGSDCSETGATWRYFARYDTAGFDRVNPKCAGLTDHPIGVQWTPYDRAFVARWTCAGVRAPGRELEEGIVLWPVHRRPLQLRSTVKDGIASRLRRASVTLRTCCPLLAAQSILHLILRTLPRIPCARCRSPPLPSSARSSPFCLVFRICASDLWQDYPLLGERIGPGRGRRIAPSYVGID